MKRRLAVLVVTLGCVGPAGIVAAQDTAQLPDLKGRWVGTSEAVVLGNVPHYSDDAASHSKPRVSAVEFTLTIEGQDGRRFWGTLTSQRDQEPWIGVIGFDGKTIFAQDSDGSIQGALVDRDTMEIVYRHSTANSVLVAANRFKRQR